MNNSIFTIRPFKKGSVWVFTEPELGIFEEPFVGEINQMIDAMLLRAGLIPGEQFTAMFSSGAIPGFEMTLFRVKEDNGGTWYKDSILGVEGWLCPVLLRFFCSPPMCIYVRAEK